MHVRILAFLAILLLPLAAADVEQGRGVGLNLGGIAPGTWDIYQFDTTGGAVSLVLTWTPAIVFFADYDLFLYPPGALNDNVLDDSERMAVSWNHPFAHHSERIDIAIGAGRHYVAVVPFQTQAETYTLSSSSGSLDLASTAVGIQTEG